MPQLVCEHLRRCEMSKKGKSVSIKKTNAMRELDTSSRAYDVSTYEFDENDLAGIHAAQGIGMEPAQVFKTLVVQSGPQQYAVCMIPVCCELDLKRAARALGVKSISMLPLKELLGVTGYIRGGCSPLAMKKKFPTAIDETAVSFDKIAFSAGQRGVQIIMDPHDLIEHGLLIVAPLCDTSVA